MKRIFFILLLSTAAALGARAQFTIGTQFGIYADDALSGISGAMEKGGRSFNYSIKPNLGYFFHPGLVAGVKFAYANCSYAEGDSDISASSINSYAMNLLMGNGLDRNHQSWKLSPYVRYRVMSLFEDKLGLWVELDGYYGVQTPREDGRLNRAERKTLYGVELHPLISYDVINNYMIFTSLDFLSFNWDANVKRSESLLGGVEVKRTNSFLFQANPLVALARAFFNIGVMKKF